MTLSTPTHSAEDIAVQISGLTVKFDGFTAVDNITLSVKRGEIFGFLGANGAGKTTTIRVLCGLIHPTEGRVCVGGIPFTSPEAEWDIKQKVGYMSQKFTLYNDLTIEENLTFTASLRNLKPKTYLERQKFILDFIAFDRPLTSFVRELPGGIKQQISLAAAMLHDPEIIFLDEPTSGVTPHMRAIFWSLIRKLSTLGKTIFVTTHYMDEAEQCDRIALMNVGKIVALDSPKNLKTTIFPEGIYEFTPRKIISYKKIEVLRHRKEFEFMEPYGLKFHASFKKTEESEQLKAELSTDFSIQKITPTLEDVFIKKK